MKKTFDKYTEAKVNFPRSMSEINIFSPYGSEDEIISNYAHLGHFLVTVNQLSTVNYALFRRCSELATCEANECYFSSFSDVDKREKARIAVLSKISGSPELRDRLGFEVNYLYDKINKFFNEISLKRLGLSRHRVRPNICDLIFGPPCLITYDKSISNLQVETASLYAFIQRLSDIYDTLSHYYDWKDITESAYGVDSNFIGEPAS